MGVTYLLDTHVLIWLLGQPDRVPDDLRAHLADRSNGIVVSAVSALEVSTKVRLGKLNSARHLVDTWAERLRELSADDLPVSVTHGLLAGRLEWEHRDPFDRLLVAQSLVEDVVLLTTDRAILALNGVRTLGWGSAASG